MGRADMKTLTAFDRDGAEASALQGNHWNPTGRLLWHISKLKLRIALAAHASSRSSFAWATL